MKKPSPWISLLIGLIGVLCAVASLTWTFYVYCQQKPKLIIDCPLDFDKPGNSMGRGIPTNVYAYNYDIQGLILPCTVINTGEKRELIRRIESTLLSNQEPIAFFNYTNPVTLEEKTAVNINLRYNFIWGQYTTNAYEMRATFFTTAGKFVISKNIMIYPM